MSVASQFFPTSIVGSGNGIPLEMLVVSGGGGAGGFYPTGSGSGGGGAIEYVNNYYASPGVTLTVTVGSGGASGSVFPNSQPGSNGGNSSVTSPNGDKFFVLGGGGGGAGTVSSGLSGGTGGSGPPTNTSATIAEGAYFIGRPASYPGSSGEGSLALNIGGGGDQSMIAATYLPTAYGFKGGFPATAQAPFAAPVPLGGPTITVAPFAGGAGNMIFSARSPGTGPGGTAALLTFSTTTGNSFRSSITGTTTGYGGGGHMIAAPPGNAPANSGYGGQGSIPGSANGGSGTVIIKYPDAFAAAPSFPGATDLTPSTPGYRTYQFTASGSITLP